MSRPLSNHELSEMTTVSYLLLGYQYRDADNHKTGDRPFVLNDLTPAGVERLRDLLAHDFIPGLIGLRDLQNDFNSGRTFWHPERDHLLHESLGLDVMECPLRDDAIEWPASRVLAALEGHITLGWDMSYRPPFFEKMSQLKAEYDADPDKFLEEISAANRIQDLEP